MRHTLFISDLHLDENHPKSCEIFLNFIKHQAPQADALYILGDFFEVWIGDDDNSPFIEQVKKSLRELVRQEIPIFFIAGNRDFLIGKKFAQATGCSLLPEFATIDLYGNKVLLTHGDALCTADEQHMKFRIYSQNKVLQRLCTSLPLTIRRKIGHYLRTRSRYHTRSLNVSKMDVVQEAVIQTLQIHRVKYLIHGHTHRPAAVNYFVGQEELQRIVLGSWERQGCVLKWFSNHKQELFFFK